MHAYSVRHLPDLPKGWSEPMVRWSGLAGVLGACSLGIHLLRYVPALPLISLGVAVIFAGLLYLVPLHAVARAALVLSALLRSWETP